MKLADYECEWCSKHMCELHIHHLTYVRIFKEKDSDVKVLCPTCHKWGDKIRKLIKDAKGSKSTRSVVKVFEEKFGYPDMKKNDRRHVVKFYKEIVKALDCLEVMKSLNSKVRKAILKELK